MAYRKEARRVNAIQAIFASAIVGGIIWGLAIYGAIKLVGAL